MSEDSFVLVSNIPPSLHTSDLRKFFTDFVETEKFSCFHYRHRPEKGKVSDGGEGEGPAPSGASRELSYSAKTCGRVHSAQNSPRERVSNCCIVQLSPSHVSKFLSKYHRKHWLDSREEDMAACCFVSKVKMPDWGSEDNVEAEEDSLAVTHVRSDLLNLPELKPPNLMPRGNVGTSTKYFLQAIKECRLPARLVGKLKLEFPQSRNRKFGQVPFDYDDHGVGGGGRGRKSNVYIDRLLLANKNRAGPSVTEEADTNVDNDTCEEWERHEALHNDVEARRVINNQTESTSYMAADADLEQQPGTKERLFEEEIELVWEKGGSGLNFYTDAQFWKEKEGDFDEQTTDDWDVDMSVYYEKKTTHDKDTVDSLDMRRSDFLRDGKHSESLFRKRAKRSGPSKPNRRRRISGSDDNIGSFEASSRGVGGKIMCRTGWKAGEGLGKSRSGISTPILGEEEGQGPSDKSGLGYHGEPLVVFSKPTELPPPGYNTARISSAFTGPEVSGERYDRSGHNLYLKFTDPAARFCRGGVEGKKNK